MTRYRRLELGVGGGVTVPAGRGLDAMLPAVGRLTVDGGGFDVSVGVAPMVDPGSMLITVDSADSPTTIALADADHIEVRVDGHDATDGAPVTGTGGDGDVRFSGPVVVRVDGEPVLRSPAGGRASDAPEPGLRPLTRDVHDGAGAIAIIVSPEDSVTLDVATTGGDVSVDGTLRSGGVAIRTVAGDIGVHLTGKGRVDGTISVTTAGGDIESSACADVVRSENTTGSTRITVPVANGPARTIDASSTTGDVTITNPHGYSRISTNSVSGTIRLPGGGPDLGPMPGSFLGESPLPGGLPGMPRIAFHGSETQGDGPTSVTVNTVDGDITIND